MIAAARRPALLDHVEAIAASAVAPAMAQQQVALAPTKKPAVLDAILPFVVTIVVIVVLSWIG